MTQERKQLGWGMVGTGMVLIGWGVIRELQLFPGSLFPSLGELAGALRTMVVQVTTYHHIWATLRHALLGWGLASSFGVIGGLLIGWNLIMRWITQPLVHFFRSLPATALFPVFLLFFGIGGVAKVGIAAFVTFWIVLSATADGVRYGSSIRYATVKLLGIRGWLLFRYVLFFEALPAILIGIKTALSMCLIVVIVVEVFVGARFGLGQKIYDAYTNYATPQLYAWIVRVGMVGVLANAVFSVMQKKILYRHS